MTPGDALTYLRGPAWRDSPRAGVADFMAGMAKLFAMGCLFIARRDAITAIPPDRTAPTLEDIATLHAWGWEWDKADGNFESAFLYQPR